LINLFMQKNVFTSWVSVLMPGEEIPTFIAHPAPVPCCPERISWPSHQHTTLHSSTSSVLPNNNNHVWMKELNMTMLCNLHIEIKEFDEY
jgi:hypothetical protein